MRKRILWMRRKCDKTPKVRKREKIARKTTRQENFKKMCKTLATNQ